MYLNESFLLNEVRTAISEPIFDAFDQSFFTDILYNKTLVEYSIYYPRWLKNCVIKKENAIPVTDPFSGKTNNWSTYKIPNFDPQNIMYLDTDNFIHPMNDILGHAGFGQGFGGLADVAVHKALTLWNPVRTIITHRFTAPDIITLEPAPPAHHDFLVDIKCRTNLNEVPSAMMFLFRDLFICDVKIDIFNSLPNLRDTSNLGGIEIDSRIGNFENAKDEKREIIEKFEANYYREPENFGNTFLFDRRP